MNSGLLLPSQTPISPYSTSASAKSFEPCLYHVFQHLLKRTLYIGPFTLRSANSCPSQSPSAQLMALDSNLLGPFDTESTSSGSPSEDTVNPTPSKQNRRTYAHCLALIRNGALLIFNGKLKLVDKQQMTAKSGLLAEKFLKTLKLESRRRLDISCAHSLLSPS